jgi:hypothetical protein
MYLAKCLNAFINDNMMAIKKILKKFDKKFYNYFGNMGPKYILDNLIMQNSDLEYLLQFKIIDETSCIIESNVKLLRDYYKEINHNDKNNRDEFYQKYNEILGYIKDIDELIYFKIQYKEWFYFRKKDKIISNKSNLYKNIMYNPILFSAYDKDDLMHKFLSRKQEIREVEEMQIPLSFKNKVNIILIYIQTFFYNTLISAIYPLIFLIIRQLDQKDINYTFLVIASTYFSIYFSILLYHCFGTKRIKCAYTVSYILFFIGSLLYIFSFQSDCKSDNGDKEKDKGKESDDNYVNEKSYTIGLLVISRVLIGLGANPTMGKNYILTYSPKYFLPRFSKFYVLFSILGHAFGPFIGFILYTNNDIYCSGILRIETIQNRIDNYIGKNPDSKQNINNLFWIDLSNKIKLNLVRKINLELVKNNYRNIHFYMETNSSIANEDLLSSFDIDAHFFGKLEISQNIEEFKYFAERICENEKIKNIFYSIND